MNMRPHVTAALLGALVASIPAALAQDAGLRSTNQVPAMVDQSQDRVTIVNIGSAALSISYLDGSWKPAQISAGASITLKSQGASLSVAFNDGAATKSMVLNAGINYAIYWDSGSGRWNMAPYDDVARRPTGLRSR